MRLDLANLPADTAQLHQLVRDMAAAVAQRDGEIARLEMIIKQLQRMQFGRRSERLDPDQLALGLDDLDADIGRVEASRPVIVAVGDSPPRRRPLPDHLPREIEIWFVVSAERFYLFAETGEAAGWVRNIRRNPNVMVRIVEREMRATARVLDGETDSQLRGQVAALAEQKYGWGDGLPVELTPLK